MPRLLPGESPDKAKRRITAERGVAPPAPPPAPSAPSPTTQPPVDVSRARRAELPPPSKEGMYPPVPRQETPMERLREAEREYQPGTPEQRRVERREEAMGRFRAVEAQQTKWSAFWESYPGWSPEDPTVELEKGVPELIGQWDYMFASNAIEGGSAPLRGSAEDVFDAGTSLYTVLKNMESLQAHLKTKLPESYAEFLGAAERGGPQVVAMDPVKAVVAAADSIAKAHPEDYTTYLTTEEGLQNLYAQSALALMTPPMPWTGVGITGFAANINEAYRQLSPGVQIGDWLREQLPEGRWTDILVEAVELAGDPVFLATVAVLPPASLTAKGLMVAGVSGGWAVGEAAAEEVGAPPLVGGLIGGAAGPAGLQVLRGITRAGRGIILESAGRNPVRGQPATELRVSRGIGPSTVDEMEVALGMRRPAFVERADLQIAEEALSPAEKALGRHTLTANTAEGELAGRLQWRSGPAGVEIMDVVAVKEGEGVGTSLLRRALDDIRALHPDAEIMASLNSAGGARLLRRAEGARFFTRAGKEITADEAVKLAAAGKGPTVELGAAQVPRTTTVMAGGEDLLSLELTDTMIRAVIERPEARDILRKTAEGMAHTIPGARRIIEIINRMAVVEDPHIKAAIGWQLGKAWGDAKREAALWAIRGKPVPFRENAIGQIWLPKAVKQAKPRIGYGKGDWIAVGDVFEDVMRGGREYLKRLTEEQVAWINDAKRILAPFTRETEAAMGIKVATREVHWPRFSLDPTAGRWRVHAGERGRARPPAMFQRIFESQEEAISEFGIRYKPGVVTQMDLYIQGMQHMSRDAVMGQVLRREGVVRVGARAAQRETFAELLGPAVPKWTETGPRREMINKELLTDIQTLIGPLSKNPLITVPQKLNAVARLLLTGSMDTGVGSLQMATLAFAFPDIWAESMARGLYAAVVDPKSIYRFLSTSPAARRYAQYAGNVGLDSEFFEATRLVGQAIPRVPGAQPVLDVATYPVRLLIRRMQVGFEGPLLFGRVLAFDAMADAARAPSLTLRAAGARQLEGKALHEEMFRLARFTDTLLGQPKFGGIVATRQAQFESAWVWFATRYTRSILGTLSYVAGRGYAPAQARVILAKMLVGGAAVMAGLIAGKGAMQGKSREEIIEEIRVALDPRSGKKHMSMPISESWFGMGGAYRSGFAAVGGLADKRNWNIDEWGDLLDKEYWAGEYTEPTESGVRLPRGFFDNPLFRPIRSRTAPWTGRLTDLLEGEDFLGYSVSLGQLVTDPSALGEYAINNFAPITLDAFLQGHGNWLQKLPAAIAEFFGLRTSPETAFEALEPVRNRVANEYYGVNFDDASLEHNRVARRRINDHPDVVAVLEGRVRPIQDKRVQDKWDKYFKQADGVRETYGLQKEDLDEIIRAGRMDGRVYRDKYGDLQLEEFGELTGLQKALGIEFEDEEAPEGTVDAALLAYYAVDLEGKDEDGNYIYYDPETGEYDWEAWYSDREATLTGLSDTDRADVEWYFRHHETELRRDFRKGFDEIIKPSGYLNTREVAAAMVGFDIDALKEIATMKLQAAGQRAGAGDVWRFVDKVLNSALGRRFPKSEPTLVKLRQTKRELNPRLDVELFRQGFVTTARSEKAIETAQALQERYPERAYFPPALAGDVEEDTKRPKAPRRAPTPAPTPAGFRLPAPTQAGLDALFEEATRGGGVSAKIIENVYRGAEVYQEHPERGVDHNKFIKHELVERLLMQKGVPFPQRHDWVAEAEGGPTGGPSGTQGQAEAQPVVAFLRTGRATHPDEQEVQDEYDLMIGAVETGKNRSEAIRLAQSHLDAHKNALRPEVRGTDRDPYPGEPEKNQAAVDGFTRVLALLRERG